MKTIGLYIGLLKIPMSLLIAFSGVFGFVIYRNTPGISLFLTGGGIFLLACGGACLNNFQDRFIDSRFSRTRHRALPAGKLPPSRALGLSIILIFLGITALHLVHYEFTLPLLGLAAILLYNGIYTPLKPRTILAIIPGAMCGMMPPLIGWTAAGGKLFSLKIFSIMVLFVLWQFPHFWLILLNHYSEYRQSPFPNMLNRFSRFQLEKIVFIWIVNFSVMLLFIPVLYWNNRTADGWTLPLAAATLITAAIFIFFHRRVQNHYLSMFKFLNGSVFLAMLFVIVKRLI